jgi:4a-hydroxytetrahydrobiopterin dehydratase
MATRVSAQDFQRSPGVADWRAANDSAAATFKTGSFARGVALVDEIGRLADGMNHHPDVDLRYPTVTVRLTTHDVEGLSDLDVDLARQISAAAEKLEIDADENPGG